jgi:hypothetical protein
MPAPSPLDVLAEELGTVAGRVEREVGLRIAATIADLLRQEAERALAFERLSRKVEDVLSGIRPPERGEVGPQGPPGPAGARGEPGEPEQLPPELAEQVRDAIRVLYAPTPFPALTAAQSLPGASAAHRPSRIERDDSGGYSLVYDDDEPQA